MSATLKTLLAVPLALALAAAPALAAEDCCAEPKPEPRSADCCAPEAAGPEIRVSNWLAPVDNYPYQKVRLFGLVETPANEGVVDRALRLVAGAGLIGLAATDPLNGGTALRAGAGTVGGVMLWTGLTGACPAYLPFGLSTRDKAAE